MRLRLVVLISGSGTLLQSLIDACSSGELAAEIVAVGADRDGIEGLRRAERAGVPTFVHPFGRGEDRTQWDTGLTELVDAHRPDLVVCAGFMKLLGPAFLARFGGRTINSHPALLPAFPGMHGPRDALEYGVKITGATVFLVDAGIDTGTILAQEAVAVRPEDDVASLHERIKIAERRQLVSTLAAWPTDPATPPTDDPPGKP